MTHLRIIHADDANFSVSCGLQGCERAFNNFYTYRNHVYAITQADKDHFGHTTYTGAVGLDMDMDTTPEYDSDSTQSEIFDGRSNRTAEEQISNDGKYAIHIDEVCTCKFSMYF